MWRNDVHILRRIYFFGGGKTFGVAHVPASRNFMPYIPRELGLKMKDQSNRRFASWLRSFD